MANSSEYAEAKIAGQSPARLNTAIKLRNRAAESLIPRIDKPRMHSWEHVANGICEIEFTNPLLVREPVSKSARVVVAERRGERQ